MSRIGGETGIQDAGATIAASLARHLAISDDALSLAEETVAEARAGALDRNRAEAKKFALETVKTALQTSRDVAGLKTGQASVNTESLGLRKAVKFVFPKPETLAAREAEIAA